MEKKTLIGRLETKFATTDTEEKTMAMSGYGAVFNNEDSYGDIIAPGAFTDTLTEHKNRGTMPLMLLNHATYDLPIGVWDDMSEDSYGLKVSGRFIDNTEGLNAYKTAKAGAITGLSIGFYVTEFEKRDGHRIITKAQVVEVSLVTFPANDLARVSDVKSQEAAPALTAAEIKALILKTIEATQQSAEEVKSTEQEVEIIETPEAQKPEQEDHETKYLQAATSAIVELRSWLGDRFQ